MSKLILTSLLAFFAFNMAQAQTFKVVKIQGKKAIVEVSDPTMISVNQSYNVGGGESRSSYGGGTFKRDHSIAGSISFTNQMTPSTGTAFDIGGSYLWNMKSYEVGPLVSLTSVSSNGSSTNSTAFGATGFYNFNENKVGVESVLSAVGTIKVASGGAAYTDIKLGGNYRWFLLSGDHCISASAVYDMRQFSGASSSAIVLEAGLLTYF